MAYFAGRRVHLPDIFLKICKWAYDAVDVPLPIRFTLQNAAIADQISFSTDFPKNTLAPLESWYSADKVKIRGTASQSVPQFLIASGFIDPNGYLGSLSKIEIGRVKEVRMRVFRSAVQSGQLRVQRSSPVSFCAGLHALRNRESFVVRRCAFVVAAKRSQSIS